LSYIYSVLNTLTLGTVDWFYSKITDFIDHINNDKHD
jgi:hypothetical protein